MPCGASIEAVKVGLQALKNGPGNRQKQSRISGLGPPKTPLKSGDDTHYSALYLYSPIALPQGWPAEPEGA